MSHVLMYVFDIIHNHPLCCGGILEHTQNRMMLCM